MTVETAQHTPGPWEVSIVQAPSGPGENWHAIEPGIGRAYGSGRIPEANARLIAAAPELLAALEDLAPFAIVVSDKCMCDPERPRPCSKCRRDNALEAIRKARGESA